MNWPGVLTLPVVEVCVSTMDDHAESGVEQLLAAPDAIMEPVIESHLRQFLEANGDPQNAIQLLTDGYCGYAPTACLFWQLCGDAGLREAELAELVWSHLRARVIAAFSAKQADTVLDTGVVPAWVEELLQLPQGRQLVSALVAEHSSSMLLGAASRRIVELVAQERNGSGAEVSDEPIDFARAFAQAVHAVLTADDPHPADELEQLEQLCCSSEVCYVYALALLHDLSEQHPSFIRLLDAVERAGAARAGPSCGRLALLMRGAPRHSDLLAALDGAAGARTELAAADVLTLHSLLCADGGRTGGDASGSAGALPAEALALAGCLRHPVLIQRLTAALFSPVNAVPYSYRPQYAAVLAHASAAEPGPESQCVTRGSGEHWHARVGALASRLSEAQRMCADNPVGLELSNACTELLKQSRGCPVVGAGVLEWIRANLLDVRLVTSRYNMAAISSILPLLEEIADGAPRLRPHATSILIDAFSVEPRSDDLEAFTRLAVKRRLLDSLLHLLLLGEALPILQCMRRCAPTVDLALLRYFVTELIAMAAPPYAVRFLRAVVDMFAHRRVEEALRAAEPATQRAVLDLIGYAHAELDGAVDEQCVALHDALLERLSATGAT